VADARQPERWSAREPELARRTSVLYSVVQDIAGSTTIVDSSKLPAYGLLLRGDPSLRLSVVHLVRDPRASVHSWRRTKRLHDSAARTHMRRRGLARSCATWSSANLLAERLLHQPDTRYTRVRYEDLVADPAGTVCGIGADLGLAVVPPVVDGGHVTLQPGHAAAGNPDRHISGSVPLRLDNAWRAEMSRSDQALVRGLTFPLSTRYGYV
jgi:hypothetical protein